MENIFIRYNNETNKYHHNYDWSFWKALHAFLNAPITSLDEYVEWVHQWKAYEKELVTAIKFFRKMRIENKPSVSATGSGSLANHYQHAKLMLRVSAREFYEKRKEKKEFFKNSDFFESRRINTAETKEKELC